MYLSVHILEILVNTAVLAHITDCGHVMVLLSLLSVLRLGNDGMVHSIPCLGYLFECSVGSYHGFLIFLG